MSVNRNIFFTLLTQIPMLVSGIICSIFITRTIGASGQGVYALTMAAIELFTFTLGFYLNTTLAVFISNRKIPEARLIGMSATLLSAAFMLLSIFLFLVYLFAENPFLFPENNKGLFYFFYFTTGFALSVFHATMTGLFQGRKLFRVVNRIQLLLATVNVLSYGTAFYLHYTGYIKITVDHILLIYTCTMFGSALIWLGCYLKHIRIRPSFQFNYESDVKPFFRFLINGHIGQIVNILIYRTDIWIVDYYLPKSDVGYYSRAVGVAQLLLLISNALTAVLNPYLSDSKNTDQEKVAGYYSRIHFTMMIVFSLAGLALSPFVFPLVYGDDFSASVIPFMIMLPATLFIGMTRIFATFNVSRNRLRENLYASLGALLLIIPLDFFIIPRFGIEGAALASAIAYLMMMLSTYYFSRTVAGLPRANYLLLKWGEIRELGSRFKNLFRS